MAGHSHSANIRFRKDRVDAKRAKTFAKLSRMITVAARQGGGSHDHNAKLRLCCDKARVLGMPKDAIERAIKKGAGTGELGSYEEIVYEGFGPGGVAIIMEILTDNRHRTAADVRMVLEKFGGNLGSTGAVARMFEKRGRFVLAADETETWLEEQLLELALAVGAEDFVADDEAPVLLCRLASFADVGAALAARQVRLREASLAYVCTQRVPVVDAALGLRLVKLIDALEDNDDVQSVFSNEEFAAEVMRALEA